MFQINVERISRHRSKYLDFILGIINVHWACQSSGFSLPANDPRDYAETHRQTWIGGALMLWIYGFRYFCCSVSHDTVSPQDTFVKNYHSGLIYSASGEILLIFHFTISSDVVQQCTWSKRSQSKVSPLDRHNVGQSGWFLS